MTNPSRSADCKAFEGCKAPLCPKDPSFNSAVWYADEPMCSLLVYRKEHWRINQRKIAKVNKTRPVIGFFTSQALQERKNVRKAVEGEHDRILVG